MWVFLIVFCYIAFNYQFWYELKEDEKIKEKYQKVHLVIFPISHLLGAFSRIIYISNKVPKGVWPNGQ